MFITSVMIPMSTQTVPLLLTAVTVYGPLYAMLVYLVE